ncbi:uncharacterized protein LOC131167476 [Malania oleifera]|uniref:uncharacterized protein LOC131167476 n=1 Tax=Malania oleifera TaxID=397392 RepID=UPI0025AE0AE4|nr:uncharacterized protein LOC131167476 [Malania oleifera]
MKPPSFSEGPDPIKAENWVQDVEEILAMLACTDKQKVAFSSFKLTGEAKRWWRLARLIKEQRLDPVSVSWSQFKELFFERYFPVIVRSAKAAEFLHLAQGQMTVCQYVARFIELSHFAPHLAPDEENKVRKFEGRPRQNLFEQVISFRAQTFAEVVDKAAIIKSGIQRGAAAQSQRKRVDELFLLVLGLAVDIRVNVRWVRMSATDAGDPGTDLGCVRDCQLRHQLPDHSGLVIRCPIEDNREILYQRECATYSFISSVYAKLMRYEAQLLDVGLAIATPTGSVVKCRRVLKGFPVTIQGKILLADLVILDMQGFEIILGMN